MTPSGLFGSGTAGTGTIFFRTDSHVCRRFDGQFSPYVALVLKVPCVCRYIPFLLGYLHTYSTYVDSVPVPAEKRLPVRNRELVPVPNFPVPVPDFFAGINL